MTRRIRCDSKLRGLPAEQRVQVDAWLFEQGWTYEKVVEGCLREFGLKVSKSSVGRYCERVNADRFAKVQRQKRMALEPKLSPAEAYAELLRRIAKLAWEEMDQPLKDINHKVVVRLVRVLIAARREKHMETRVWVERRKVENWLARECLRHWRREVKKQAHVSYLPLLVECKGNGGKQLSMIPPFSGSLVEGREEWPLTLPQRAAERKAPPLPGPLPHCVAEREKSGSDDSVAPVAPGRPPIQVNAVEYLALKRHGCRDPAKNGRKSELTPMFGIV